MFARLNWIWPSVVLCVGVAFSLFGSGSPSDIVFLSVGQGDCTLIRHGGWTVLVDTAAKNQYVDLGRRLAVPELRRLGVGKIDLLLLTHPDSDHIGGLEAITSRWKIGAIGIPSRFRNHALMQQALARVPQVPVIWIEKNSHFSADGLMMDFDFHADPADSDNSGSLVVKVTCRAGTAVLSGDADIEAEKEMAATGVWTAQVLKAGHHGSRTSTSPEWLAEVKAKWFVVSCGRANQFGHPHREVVSLAESRKMSVLRTDVQGTVRFELGPEGYCLVGR